MDTQQPAPDLRSSRRSISYRTIEIDGLNIFYREAGPADAPVVLMLHGFPSSSRMWEPLLPLLADKYHLISLAPDVYSIAYVPFKAAVLDSARAARSAPALAASSWLMSRASALMRSARAA